MLHKYNVTYEYKQMINKVFIRLSFTPKSYLLVKNLQLFTKDSGLIAI